MKTRGLFIQTVLVLLLAWTSFSFAGATLSERTFKHLSRAQALMGEDNYQEAEEILLSLDKATAGRAYSNAVVSQTMGYLYSMQGDYPKAKVRFASAIDSGKLPLEPAQNLRANLARLYIADAETTKALPLLKDWFSEHEGDPDANMHALYGSAYAQIKQFPPSIVEFERAVAVVDEPKEDWHRILAAMYASQKNYDKATHHLEVLVSLDANNKTTWKQLSGMYMARNTDDQALNALSSAYHKGLLDKGSEYENLANFFAFKGEPFEAGKALATSLEKELSTPSYKLYRRLGNFWLQAKEDQRAIDAFRAALRYERNDKDVHRYLASIYLEIENWAELKSLLQPYQPEGDADKGRRELMLGIAHYRLGDTAAAKSALGNARSYKKTASSARQWLAYIDDITGR